MQSALDVLTTEPVVANVATGSHTFCGGDRLQSDRLGVDGQTMDTVDEEAEQAFETKDEGGPGDIKDAETTGTDTREGGGGSGAGIR